MKPYPRTTFLGRSPVRGHPVVNELELGSIGNFRAGSWLDTSFDPYNYKTAEFHNRRSE